MALARAIVPRPAVMLMDEPFSGLDVQLRERLQEETLALLRETRATCLIVTHAPAEAIRLGDRIAVMRAGRLVQAGKAEELYRNPADLFVARLFSEINEIPLQVEGGALRTPIGVFAVPGLDEGDAAILCIRRRAIRLGASRPGPAGPRAARQVPGRPGACWRSPRRASSGRCVTLVREWRGAGARARRCRSPSIRRACWCSRPRRRAKMTRINRRAPRKCA